MSSVINKVIISFVFLVFLAGQLPLVFVYSPSDDQQNQCDCLSGGCQCDHSGGVMQCHRTQAQQATSICYTATSQHDVLPTVLVLINIKPFLPVVEVFGNPATGKSIEFVDVRNEYSDVILPGPDKPPRLSL